MENETVPKRGVLHSIESSINYIKEILISVQRLTEKEDMLSQESLLKVKEIVSHIRKLYDELCSVPLTLDKTYAIIKDIIAHVHESRSQLKGAVDGLIKQTGEQLVKVTSATEVATNKILDVSDSLTEKQNSLIEKLDGFIAEKPELSEMFEDIKGDIFSQQDDTFLILDYLQFQDITSQQLESAFSMLNQIEDRLLAVAKLLEGLDDLTFDALEKRRTAYDPNAEFKDQSAAQKEIDDIFKVTDEHKLDSQEEIDKIFNKK